MGYLALYLAISAGFLFINFFSISKMEIKWWRVGLWLGYSIGWPYYIYRVFMNKDTWQ